MKRALAFGLPLLLSCLAWEGEPSDSLPPSGLSGRLHSFFSGVARARDFDEVGSNVPDEVRIALLSSVEGDSLRDAGEGESGGTDPLSIEAQPLQFDQAEQSALEKELDSKVQPVLARYAISRTGDVLAYGYLDTHRVRTLSESLLIVLSPRGEVRRVVVLAFAEPPEYQPRAIWYAQFEGLPSGGDLKYGREVDAVTGATLTGRATVDAVERVQKLHEWFRLRRPQEAD